MTTTAKTRRKSSNTAAPDTAAPPTAGDATAAPQTAGGTTAATVDRELVAIRAYELYLARGGGDGQELDDWLCAERELIAANGRPDENT